MARMISSEYTPKLAFTLRTVFNDGSYNDRVFHIGDLVENLRYSENRQIKSATGVLKKIVYTVKSTATSRRYNNLSTARSYFSEDVVATQLVIDASSQYDSNVIKIPTRELLEDAGVANVNHMEFFLTYGIDFRSDMSDLSHNEFSLWEGAQVNGLHYLTSDQIPVSGTIMAIQYNVKTLQPTALICVNDDGLMNIDMDAVIKIDEIFESVDPTTADFSTLLASGGFLKLGVGTTSSVIAINDDTTIVGAYPGLSGLERKKAGLKETVLSGNFSLAKLGSSITLVGLTLTKNAVLRFTNSGDITLKNCIIEDQIASDTNACNVFPSGNAIRMEVVGCYFGNCNTDNGIKMKNCLELNAPLKDGTVISGNYFEKTPARNNLICLYAAEDGATIDVSENIFEFSGNGIRVGTKGNVKVTYNLIKNTYYDTYTSGDDVAYAGLLLIQPYGTTTTSFAGNVININKTVHKDKQQLWYMYCGKDDTQITGALQPTVSVNGVVVMEPEV